MPQTEAQKRAAAKRRANTKSANSWKYSKESSPVGYYWRKGYTPQMGPLAGKRVPAQWVKMPVRRAGRKQKRSESDSLY